MALKIGDAVEVLVVHTFQRDEWKCAEVIAVEPHKISVRFKKTEQLMALAIADRGQLWR